MTRQYIRWAPVLARAKAIVKSYDRKITLRQVFYQLVSLAMLPNTKDYYKRLSARTAEARRNNDFPDLKDEGREIVGTAGFTSPASALRYMVRTYSRDWTEGQPVAIYAAIEKRALADELADWFGGKVSILALAGYASQSFCDQVKRDVADQGRPAILIIAVDFDPTGPDIERDFIKRTDCWAKVHKVALTQEQADDLPEAVDNDPLTVEKLEKDPRARAFVEQYGELKQVELDALEPDDLRQLYQEVIDLYWDDDAYFAVLERQEAEREQLQQVVDGASVDDD